MKLADYLTSDATTLAGLLASGDVTPAQLLALARERAAQVNPQLNAVVATLDEVADERAASSLEGPFAGVPFLVKDLAQEYAGFPTSSGSRALAHDVADEHAVITQRFLDAGLVVFGKTNTPEFGAKGITEDSLLGTAHNPWNLAHTPGGSSGGSGAAVAAGIVPAAGANDGGGSIRIPAACNGLVGLKLSRGYTAYGPQTGESMFGMVTQGVVSRTVRDSAGLLDAVAGAPSRYAAYVAARPDSFLASLDERPRGLRIGFSSASAINPSPDPEAVAAVESTAALLAELGHEVEEVAPPHDDEALARDFLTIWFAQLHGQISEIKKRLGAPDSAFEADSLAVAEIGRAAGVGALFGALDNVHAHTRALEDFHERYDLFLTPTLAKPPLAVGSIATAPLLQSASRVIARLRAGKLLAATGILDQLITENLGWVPYTQLANLTGRPAISVPMHWTAAGLPLGVQFVGPLASDGLLLRLAAQLEEARPWFARYAELDPSLQGPVTR
ncbi:amidase [Nocardioides sp. Kera G14]|uniref:amidase n=1 Tax=Nocardioides sp. Kera G14 TaxID=2884264 RepID=UPI001D121F61|nr:amidase [Nocardioides sp. Kera G14]UDY22968.1 amidase [Nocardioides sp. Kera G14]